MFEVLALFGGLWFWLIFGTFSVLALYNLENENFGYLFVISVVTIMVGFLFGPLMEVFYYYSAEPMLALLHFAGYFVVGSIYSVYKWYTFIQKKRQKYLDIKSHFLHEHKVKGNIVPDNLNAQFKSQIRCLDIVRGDRLAPTENKERLTNWIIFWPWSLIWTIFDDPFRKIAQWFIARLGGVYRGITDRALRDVNDDIGGDYDE